MDNFFIIHKFCINCCGINSNQGRSNSRAIQLDSFTGQAHQILRLTSHGAFCCGWGSPRRHLLWVALWEQIAASRGPSGTKSTGVPCVLLKQMCQISIISAITCWTGQACWWRSMFCTGLKGLDRSQHSIQCLMLGQNAAMLPLLIEREFNHSDLGWEGLWLWFYFLLLNLTHNNNWIMNYTIIQVEMQAHDD